MNIIYLLIGIILFISGLNKVIFTRSIIIRYKTMGPDRLSNIRPYKFTEVMQPGPTIYTNAGEDAAMLYHWVSGAIFLLVGIILIYIA